MADATINEWSYELCRLLNAKQHKAGRSTVYWAKSTVGDRIKVKDLVRWRDGRLENDADAFHIVARHNVESHTLAHQQVLQMLLVQRHADAPVCDVFQTGYLASILSVIDMAFHQHKTRRGIFKSLRKHEFALKFSIEKRRNFIDDCRPMIDVDV